MAPNGGINVHSPDGRIHRGELGAIMADMNSNETDEHDTLIRQPKTDTRNKPPSKRAMANNPVPPRAGSPRPDEARAATQLSESPPELETAGLPPVALDLRDRYQAGSLLGEGGMGRIFLTTDSRIGRDVAMKVLRKRYSTQPDTVDRFLREARVQGQLEHPSIVPVYDLMRAPDGKLGFTMKRVRGKTIEQIVEGIASKDLDFVDAYPRRKLLRAFSAACLAVDFAHTHGVLHRDLKPSNLMLGDYGEVYVLDWGLAKVAGLPDIKVKDEAVTLPETNSSKTIDGAVLGTPGYMAPEQAMGQTATMDASSDVYALGTILYEMLSLQPLHERGTISKMMHSTVRGADGRPSFKAPQRSIPSELDAVCVKATQLKQEHRFASARELHDAIERYLDGEQDMKLMREMAQAHARAAEVAAEYALASGPNAEEERVRALREVGRALALDPSHPEAQRVLLTLLKEPPEVLPDAEMAELTREDQDEGRMMSKINGILNLSFVVTTALVLWMGVKSTPAAVMYVLVAATATASAFYSPKREHRDTARFANVIISTLAIGFMSTMFGPLFLIPGLAAMMTMSASFATPTRSARALIISIGVLSVLVPIALELAGLLPASYEFTERGLLILPRMHHFPRGATLAFLAWIGLGHIISISIMMGRLHEARIRALEKLHKQTWQLKQLVADDPDRRR